jgi:hypothetical protein
MWLWLDFFYLQASDIKKTLEFNWKPYISIVIVLILNDKFKVMNGRRIFSQLSKNKCLNEQSSIFSILMQKNTNFTWSFYLIYNETFMKNDYAFLISNVSIWNVPFFYISINKKRWKILFLTWDMMTLYWHFTKFVRFFSHKVYNLKH